MSYVQPMFIFYDEKSGCSYLSDGKFILSADEHAEAVRTLTRFLEHHDSEAIDRLRLQQCQHLAQETLTHSLEERQFRRSKNRSKSWVSRCKHCQSVIDDAVSESYWWRRDLDNGDGNGGPFCSSDCAINFHSIEKMAEELFQRYEESNHGHSYFRTQSE